MRHGGVDHRKRAFLFHRPKKEGALANPTFFNKNFKMEELHWIAARARAITCLESARGHHLTRFLYIWKNAAALLAGAEAEYLSRSESASLASLLANARVRIVELSTESVSVEQTHTGRLRFSALRRTS